MIRRKRVDASATSNGGMEDVNEQELAKATDGQQFFGESEVDRDSDKEPSLSASFSEQTADEKDEEHPMDEPPRDGPRNGEDEKNLPATVPEASDVVEIPVPEGPPKEEENTAENIMSDGENDGDGGEEPPDDDEEPPKERRHGGKIYVAIIAVCFVLSVLFCVMTFLNKRDTPQQPESVQTAPDSAETKETEPTVGENRSVSAIYSEHRNSSVTVTAVIGGVKKYFSGTAVFGDGYIATVYGEVAEADRVEITASDGKTYPATVVDGDPTVDLVLLKTDAAELEYVNVSPTVSLEAGRRVYAIGTVSDAQFGGSLFEGVVSFGERTVELTCGDGSVRRAKAVQIGGFGDGSLWGSPVFDESGAAVAMVWSGSEENAVGLALPIDRVLTVLEFFKDGEIPTAEVMRTIAYATPTLGVVGENYSLGEVYGVRITDFSVPTCDAAVKLRRDDVIVKVGETVTADTASVREAIYALAPGDTVEVHVIRNEQHLSFFVQLI